MKDDVEKCYKNWGQDDSLGKFLIMFPSMREFNRIIESLEHFYGHLEIACCDRLGLCSIENKDAVEQRKNEIIEFCNKI